MLPASGNDLAGLALPLPVRGAPALGAGTGPFDAKLPAAAKLCGSTSVRRCDATIGSVFHRISGRTLNIPRLRRGFTERTEL